MRKHLIALAAIAALGLTIGTARAAPTFTTSSNSVSGLGDETGSGLFDILSVSGLSGVAAGLKNIATLEFDTGPNCSACTLTPSGLLPVGLTVGAVTKVFDVGYSWASVGPVDTVSFGPIGPLSFHLGGGEVVTAHFLTPAAMSGGPSIGVSASEPLQAQFTVPEPASLSLFGVGLFGFAAFRRRNPFRSIGNAAA